jgi:hypothetical protein
VGVVAGIVPGAGVTAAKRRKDCRRECQKASSALPSKDDIGMSWTQLLGSLVIAAVVGIGLVTIVGWIEV